MRTIVAFLFSTLLGLAQSAPEIDRQLQKIAAHPDAVPDRVALLNALANRNVAVAPERVRDLRRVHILWLIEHHPETANIFEQPQLLLAARGRLADPAGSAEAAGLWQEQAKKTNPAIIANAAIYLSAVDPPAALALLDKSPNDPALARARGWVDAASVLGLSGIGQNIQFGSSAALRSSAQAKAARAEIDASTNPYLVGKAGMLFSRNQVEIPGDLTFGDDDVPTLGERWLRRAMELAPPGDEWKPALAQVLQTKANRTTDPKEKTRILTEALSLVPDTAKTGILTNLILAEFDASDDAAAQRDARQLMAGAPKNGYAYSIAQTVLGRIAAANGDIKEAKAHLLASVTMPAAIKNTAFDPNMTLAQDFYDAGDKTSVVEFLEAARDVWKGERGRIDRMISFIKKAPSADLVQLSRQFPGAEIVRHPAPAFEAKDLDGKSWTREQLAGKVVALEFGTAPLAEKVSQDFAPRGAVLLKVQDDDTKRRFEVLTNPTVVVIDRQGNVTGYRSGSANEADWRTEFENGFGRGPAPPITLPAPKQAEQSDGGRVAWEPVEGAESYVVEWDPREESVWAFDHDGTVHVMPTRETAVTLDLKGFTRVRWRVYAVPKSGQPGAVSPWYELEGLPVTKIYK